MIGDHCRKVTFHIRLIFAWIGGSHEYYLYLTVETRIFVCFTAFNIFFKLIFIGGQQIPPIISTFVSLLCQFNKHSVVTYISERGVKYAVWLLYQL